MVLNLIFPVCMMNECIIMIKIHWTQGFMEIYFAAERILSELHITDS